MKVTFSIVSLLLLASAVFNEAATPPADWSLDPAAVAVEAQSEGFTLAKDPASGAPCLVNDGKQKHALWLSLPDEPVFHDVSTLTLVARVKALDVNRGGWLLFKNAPKGCDWGLCLITREGKRDKNNFKIGLRIANVTKWIPIDRDTFPPEKWNCYAVTLDLEGDRIPRLYINGELAGEGDSYGLDDFFRDENGILVGTVDAYEFNDTHLPSSGKSLYVGSANRVKKNSFQGSIAWIHFYRECLDVSQIKAVCSQ